MNTVTILLQVIIAVGIFNVWIVRYGRATPWRPDGARNMQEELARYGISGWRRRALGAAKLLLAVLLVVGIWHAPLAALAAAGMAALMLGALVAHARIRDPYQKSLPALALFTMSVLVAVLT